MCVKNFKGMTDVELMNMAKRRVMLRDIFKWHCGTYFVGVICIAVYLFISYWTLWGVLLIVAWGVFLAIHGFSVRFRLSKSGATVSDEYYRLKRFQ